MILGIILLFNKIFHGYSKAFYYFLCFMISQESVIIKTILTESHLIWNIHLVRHSASPLLLALFLLLTIPHKLMTHQSTKIFVNKFLILNNLNSKVVSTFKVVSFETDKTYAVEIFKHQKFKAELKTMYKNLKRIPKLIFHLRAKKTIFSRLQSLLKGHLPINNYLEVTHSKVIRKQMNYLPKS